MIKFLKEMICLIRGHRWGPTNRYTENWYVFEDVTERGGLTLGHAQGGDGLGEDCYIRTFEDTQCMFCKCIESEEV
jgi:hypothetical protein